MMMRKRNKRKYHLRIAAVVILLLAITNTATYRITEQYIQGKENVKEIAYKGSNTVSIKNVTKKLNPASFKIDRQLVKQIKNVMIIAHPDDETLWAGDHIMKDRYLIICLTNGNNKIRKKEFEKAMELTGNYGIILNYPDNPKHVKNNWKKVKDPIRNDIDYVLNYKKWDSIPGALDLQDAQAKENLMSEVYLSQGYAHRIFNHMVPYEKFIRYKDWYFGF